MADHKTPVDELMRMRWAIGGAVLFAVAVSVGLAFLLSEPVWAASTQVRVGRLNLDQYTDSAYVERILRTTAEIVEAGSDEGVLNEGGNLDVAVLPETELLEVSVSHADMSKATQLLENVVEVSQNDVSSVYDDAISMVTLEGSTTVTRVETNYVTIGVVAGILTLIFPIGLAITRSFNPPAQPDRVSRRS